MTSEIFPNNSCEIVQMEWRELLMCSTDDLAFQYKYKKWSFNSTFPISMKCFHKIDWSIFLMNTKIQRVTAFINNPYRETSVQTKQSQNGIISVSVLAMTICNVNFGSRILHIIEVYNFFSFLQSLSGDSF